MDRQTLLSIVSAALANDTQIENMPVNVEGKQYSITITHIDIQPL